MRFVVPFVLLFALACGGLLGPDCPTVAEAGGVEYVLAVEGGPPEAVVEVLEERLEAAEACSEVRVEDDRVVVTVIDVTPDEIEPLIGESAELRIAAELSEERRAELFGDGPRPSFVSDAEAGGSEAAREAVEASFDRLPEGVFGAVERREESPAGWDPVLFEEAGALGGAEVARAWADTDPQFGDWRVYTDFDAAGTEAFHDLTARQVDERIGIVLGGEVVSMPVVREPIPGGRAVLTLGQGATEQEARAVAVAVRVGALPSPVRVESVRLVGPAEAAP